MSVHCIASLSNSTFLVDWGCVHAYFAKAESAFWNADSKRRSKTPFTGVLFIASHEKKTISWACTAHCSRLLFELKWTGKAFIWRHLNVVICDFAFMLPPESAFCSNHDRKRALFEAIVRAQVNRKRHSFSHRKFRTPSTFYPSDFNYFIIWVSPLTE